MPRQNLKTNNEHQNLLFVLRIYLGNDQLAHNTPTAIYTSMHSLRRHLAFSLFSILFIQKNKEDWKNIRMKIANSFSGIEFSKEQLSNQI